MKGLPAILILLTAANYCCAGEWHGLKPLRSTRTDVVRLLNHCSEQKEACAFTLGDEDVYILFSRGLTEEYGECATRLPSETVMFIDVELRTKPKLSSLQLEKRKFRSFNPSAPVKMDRKGYWSEIDGLLVNTLNGKVLELIYLAKAADKPNCPTFYQDPESFISLIPVHVPIVYVECSPSTVRAGKEVVCSASTNVNARRGYTWSVTGGRIISGQYTHQITIDTSGLSERVITTTVETRAVFSRNAATSFSIEIKESREGVRPELLVRPERR